MNKKGWEVSEIGKLLVAVVVLVILAFGVYFFIAKRGGGEGGLLDSIKNIFRFGRA